MVATEPVGVNSAAAPARDAEDAGTRFAAEALRQLAARPLFAPLAALMEALPTDAFAGPEALNTLVAASDPRPRTREGRLIRFVRPDGSRQAYELRIADRGEVQTRPNNWHDLFNALVWMRFPRTKASLNALHRDEMSQASERTGRGPLRDAATQFDESGIIVASALPELLALLTRRCWKELFWRRRAEVVARMRFLVFGHGLYDALRAPFYRICGRAALVEVDQDVIAADIASQCRRLDAIVAARFAARSWYPKPKALMALPLLGIPGVIAQNACAGYYDDARQFRPLPEEDMR